MSWEDAAGFVVCLGGLNPLCWAGCASPDEVQPVYPDIEADVQKTNAPDTYAPPADGGAINKPDAGAIDTTINTVDAGSPPIDANTSSKINIVKENTTQINGVIDTLFPSIHGCYAIANTGNSFELVEAKPDGTSQIINNALPGFGQRNYGNSLLLSNGLIAATYQSTAFNGQSGTHHGLVLLQSNGTPIADYTLFNSHGATRPSALLEQGGQLMVLFNNCETGINNSGQVQCLNSASIYTLPTTPEMSPEINKHDLPGLTNAGAMALRTKPDGSQELIIAAAGDYNINPDGQSVVVSINPTDFSLNKKYESIKGLGLNGNASVDINGNVLFTGQAGTGESIAKFDGQGLLTYTLPAGLSQKYVSGGAYAGLDVLFNITDFSNGAGHVFSYKLNTQTQETSQLGDAIIADFGLPFVARTQDTYCSGATGTAIDNEGNKKSQVDFWMIQ